MKLKLFTPSPVGGWAKTKLIPSQLRSKLLIKLELNFAKTHLSGVKLKLFTTSLGGGWTKTKFIQSQLKLKLELSFEKLDPRNQQSECFVSNKMVPLQFVGSKKFGFQKILCPQ